MLNRLLVIALLMTAIVLPQTKADAQSSTVSLNDHLVAVPPPTLDLSVSPLLHVVSSAKSPVSWNSPINYQVIVANVSTQTVEFSFLDTIHTPAPAATVFDAVILDATCKTTACAHTISNRYFVGSTPKSIIDSVPPMVVLAPGERFIVDYAVVYSAVCQVRKQPVTIVNSFSLEGVTISGGPVTSVKHTVATPVVMPDLKTCSMNVNKLQSAAVAPALTFNSTSVGYVVKWINPSPSTTVRMGSLWDVLSTDSALYATVPISASAVTCTPSPGVKQAGGAAWSYSQSSSTQPVSTATAVWQGVKAIVLPGAEIPPLGSITCNYSVKVGSPSPAESRCQSGGKPLLRNTTLADIDPDYNQDRAPFAEKTTVKKLPLCRNVIINKTAVPPVVLPGDRFVWKTQVTNVGPKPNTPIGSFWVRDVVPVSGPTRGLGTCIPARNCSPFQRNNLGWNARVTSLAANQSVMVSYPARAPLTPSEVQNTAIADAALPGFYFHGGVPPQGVGTVSVEWPTVTTLFSPPTISSGEASTVLFTIKNLDYKPGVTGMAFTAQLPAGLDYGPSVVSTCGGSAVLITSGNQTQLVVSGALFFAGGTKCLMTIQARSSKCGTFTHSASDVTGAVKVGADGLNAVLAVNGCNTG